MTRVLGPLHRAFGTLNRWFAAPVLRMGLGPLFSTPVAGSLMLLRTTGRKSGLVREAPLGYVIAEGSVYVCAGFGTRTAWYRNLEADPRVEVLLPTVAFSGVAERVTDRDEWDRVYPAYLRALGVIGRMVLGDPHQADPERLESVRQSLPLVRIRPTGLATGPADPGGGLWIVVQGTWLVILGWLGFRLIRRLRSGRGSAGCAAPDRRS
jgi:deazaflavin-dependent oxidoreductase (nitroreductase family)